MEHDIADAMLSALTNSQDEKPVPKMSKQSMINYVMRNINSVTLDDKICIGRLLNTKNRHNIKSNASGLMIDLNQLDDNVITSLYELLDYKISKRI